MLHEITYLCNDSRCEDAVADIQSRGMNAWDWLEHHKPLYDNVTYSVNNMPRIADCHYHHQHYPHILEFATLYDATLQEWGL